MGGPYFTYLSGKYYYTPFLLRYTPTAPSVSSERNQEMSEQEADLPIPIKEKVCRVNEEMPSSAAAEAEDDGLCRLSGDKPFWDVIIAKSHVSSPYNLHVPARMASVLPCNDVAAVLEHGDKKWDLSLRAKGRRRAFGFTGWRIFAKDNNLECDDACIFEVMESSSALVRLRVVILRNTGCLPPELEAEFESRGKTIETAIEID